MARGQVRRSKRVINGTDKNRWLLRKNIRKAKQLSGQPLTSRVQGWLKALTEEFGFSVEAGDLLLVGGYWYVSHAGLLSLARRKKCRGIEIEALPSLCDISANRFVLRATVYPSEKSIGFVGYGDADPSNVSDLVRGAEMRVAETRAVNRALRKAYGIGVCSVEEIGGRSGAQDSDKLPPQPTNGNGTGTVRDRLCQLIRQYQLDPNLVKAYALEHCGVKTLREATREQVEAFVAHLADWAEKDRNALLCQLNSYPSQKEEAA